MGCKKAPHSVRIDYGVKEVVRCVCGRKLASKEASYMR